MKKKNNKIRLFNKPKLQYTNKAISEWIKTVMDDLKLTGFSVNVIFVLKEEITLLNRQYRRKDKPTDVITFSMLEGKFPEYSYNMLGDIYLCCECIKPSTDREIARRILHGVLHLAGYDHKKKNEYDSFMLIEEKYLKMLDD